MKNIFKKTLKFISSRLLYLVVGIFLAVGATYVYATWDQAKTGGSGQLTEANWNELVTMIQNNINSGPSSWDCGVYNGGTSVSCGDGRTLISGGCIITDGPFCSNYPEHAGRPINNGWSCNALRDYCNVQAFAWCCK